MTVKAQITECPECGATPSQTHFPNCTIQPNPLRAAHEAMYRLGAEAMLAMVREDPRWLDPVYSPEKLSARLWSAEQ